MRQLDKTRSGGRRWWPRWAWWRRWLPRGAALLVLVTVLLWAGLNVLAMMHGPHVATSQHSLAFAYHGELSQQRISPGGHTYRINHSDATFDLDVATPDAPTAPLFADYAAAWRYGQSQHLPLLPSVTMVQGACKQFDDGLCVAVELALQEGTPGTVLGKRAALLRLQAALLAARATAAPALIPALDKAADYVADALAAGANTGTGTTQPAPPGFWSWNAPLQQLYVQDRQLMNAGGSLPRKAAVLLSTVVARDPALQAAFARSRAVTAGLCDPPVYLSPGGTLGPYVGVAELAALLPPASGDALPTAADLAAAAQLWPQRYGATAGFALEAYADSPELALLRRAATSPPSPGAVGDSYRQLLALLCGPPPPDSMGDVLARVRSGQLALAPRADSGYYDYQWYTQETLAVPERAPEHLKLFLSQRYRRRLEQAFASGLAGARETHLKHLVDELGGVSDDVPEPVALAPVFSVEPTATVYLRQARAYRYLYRSLTTALGPEVLAQLHRPREVGPPSALPLDQELRLMALRCYGLYARLAPELGLLPDFQPGELTPEEVAAARVQADTWLAQLATDPDLAQDVRAAAAVPSSPHTRSLWATVGVALVRVRYSYRTPPVVNGFVEPHYVPGEYYLPTAVFRELPIALEEPPPSRAAFRQWCDQTYAGRNPVQPTPPWRHILSARALPVAWTLLAAALVALLATGWPALVRVHWARLWWRAVGGAALLVVLLPLTAALVLWLAPGLRLRVMLPLAAVTWPELVFNTARKDATPASMAAALDLLATHPNPQVRYYAAAWLATVTEHGTTCYFDNRYINYSHPRLDLRAQLDMPAALACLRAAADEPDAETARCAMEVLCRVAARPSVDFLLALAARRQQEDWVYTSALVAVAQAHDRRALPTLLAATRDPRPQVRQLVVHWLTREFPGDPAVDARLEELLTSSVPGDVRKALVCCEFHLKHHAAGALATPAMQAALAKLAGAPSERKDTWRRAAKMLLPATLADPELQARLAAYVRSPRDPRGDNDAHMEAAKFLRGPEQAAATLDWLQQLAADAGNPAATNDLLNAIKSLGHMGDWDEPLLPFFLGLRQHPDPRVRAAADLACLQIEGLPDPPPGVLSIFQ